MKISHAQMLIRRFATIQNITMVVALIVVFSWVWGTVETLQKNFYYQQKLDQLTAEVELEKLRNENLAFEQKYLKSDEFLELSARQQLGKANPGEKLIILPDSSDVKDTTTQTSSSGGTIAEPSNFSQWMRFLFGNRNNDLTDTTRR